MAFLGVYGHVNIDTILLVDDLPERGHTVPSLGEVDRIGGTAGTIARSAARLGVPTALAAFVGEDFPAEYHTHLEDLGIDLTDLRTRPGKTPHCWLVSVPGGDHVSVIDQGVYGDDGPFPLLDYTLLNSEWVHVTTGDVDMHMQVLRDAAKADRRTMFDPAQELHYRYDARNLERCLNDATVFICNDVELGHALDKLSYGDPVQLHDHVDTVLVTQGADGVDVRTDDGVQRVPACPVRGEHHPETTGAGDVFRGGLYAGLHDGATLPDAVRWGAVAASLYLEAEGAELPDTQALAARLDEWTAS